MHELSILSLGISLLASFSFPLALAHPTASASPNPIPTLSRSSLEVVTPPLSLALTLPLPHNNDHNNDNNELITGNFSRSCAQITLMNEYFLAATCRPIEPAVVSGGSEEEQEQVEGKEGKGDDGTFQSQSPEFNQLDLNLCVGFDQGTTTTTAGGGGSGSSYNVPGKLIWQAL